MSGVKHNATNKEANNVKITIAGMERKNVPGPFCMVIKGKNANTVVSVPDATAQPTWLLPLIAAFIGLSPKRKWRPTFSTTTMALSTSKPKAITKPTILICCKPKPAISSQPIAMKMDRGMAVTMTTADLKPKASNDKIATSNKPSYKLLKNPSN